MLARKIKRDNNNSLPSPVIPRREVLRDHNAYRRALLINDGVRELDSRRWRIISGVTGCIYLVQETVLAGEPALHCNCPAQGVCRHMMSAIRKTLTNPERIKFNPHAIRPGDRVLVGEGAGFVWHTVEAVQGGEIKTQEVKYFFRLAFVVRHERADEAAESEAA